MTKAAQLYEEEKLEYGQEKAQEKAQEIARKMLKDNADITTIMKYTDLSKSDILKLKETIGA